MKCTHNSYLLPDGAETVKHYRVAIFHLELPEPFVLALEMMALVATSLGLEVIWQKTKVQASRDDH